MPKNNKRRALATVSEEKRDSLGFEREVLASLRGEIRKVNQYVSEEERNGGMVQRIALAVLGRELMPTSERGLAVLRRYLAQRPKETLFTGNATGQDCRKEPIERVAVRRIMGEA